MDLPASPPIPWTQRLWSRLTGWFVRAPQAPVLPVDEPVRLGADYGAGVAAPTYDPAAAMSAFAAFPWVYAALLRGSGDLARVPLRIVRGEGKKQAVVDYHPGLSPLLQRPFLGWTGRQLRRQAYVDLRLTGNFYGRTLGGSRPIGLQRLHPSRVRIEPDPVTGWDGYLYEGAGSRVSLLPEEVLHARLPSWEEDPRGLYGTGAIQALHDDLTTDRRAAKSASVLAKRGRPDMIVSPVDPLATWPEEFRAELRDRLDALLEKGGTVVVGGGAKLDLPSWAPRDIEFPALRQLVREAVLAVTGVPPHLVGLPVANYAQAKEQTLVYWEMLQAVAEDLSDAVWTPLARRFDPSLSVVHNFSGVDALQEARTARQARVKGWVDLGATPAGAAAYEGFDDAPVPDQASEKSTPASAVPAAPPPVPADPDPVEPA